MPEDADRTAPEPEPEPEPLGFLVHALRQALRPPYEEGLGPLGLTLPQLGALAALRHRPGASVAQLAGDKGVTPQSMAGHVAALEAAGLVTRGRPAGRGHVLALELSEDGRRALRRGLEALCAAEDRVWADVPTAERAHLRALLRAHLAPLTAAGGPRA